jgi:hypothetical protein
LIDYTLNILRDQTLEAREKGLLIIRD